MSNIFFSGLRGEVLGARRGGLTQSLPPSCTTLITSSLFVLIKVANVFNDKTMGVNYMWQTDFTDLTVIGRN